MKENTLPARYKEKTVSIKWAIREIISIYDISQKDRLQVVIPALMHLSKEDKEWIINNNLTAEVLPDFPHVEGLDVGNSVEVSKYLTENYNKLTIRRLDGYLSYIVVLYWRILRKNTR